jgi:hypothetical protein
LFELSAHDLGIDLDPFGGILDGREGDWFEHETEALPVTQEIGKHHRRAGADV